MSRIIFYYIFIFILLLNNPIYSKDRIILASTTSTHDSGLLEYVNNFFENEFKIKVHVISLGTGQAIELAKNGDADILLVHHTPSELDFMESNFGVERKNLMYNDYIFVGPKKYNHNCKNIKSFLQKVKNNKLTFISRGDESGTHKKEKELWKIIKLDTQYNIDWYIENGQGMGTTLMMANEINAITLTDRSTWIIFKNKQNLKIICENKNELKNQYGIILINPNLNKNINFEYAKKYFDWINSIKGKKIIDNYRFKNQQLFFSNK